MSESLLYLTETHLDALDISTHEVIESIEHLVREHKKSKVWNAPKASFHTPDDRFMMSTMAAADDPPLFSVKSLVLNPRNPARDLRLINSLITLLDSDTGRPLAVVDGNWVTALRTAALSGVAAKRLALAHASVVGFIGCGVQARSHLQVFADLFPLTEIRAFGRGSKNRDALCQRARDMDLKAVASESAKSAISGADIVVTSVTKSVHAVPFVDAHWLKAGAFAAITDIDASWIKDRMDAFDRIVIDDLVQEANMPVPLVPEEWVSGDLSQLVNGDIVARERDDQRTAFSFRGFALGDLALAGLAYQRACEKSTGEQLG